jgi:hypothetical protein
MQEEIQNHHETMKNGKRTCKTYSLKPDQNYFVFKGNLEETEEKLLKVYKGVTAN